MHECDICYNTFITINILKCCKNKRMCIKCKNKYGKQSCPFCRQNMNRKHAIVFINNKDPCPENSIIIMSVMNYNIVKIW